ncbi:MAG: hypothetical protein APR62_01035 [Smithella sp. SDB]|nr:MAG: hypothetical protein APR62_01035 [Smithella sp. SDB]
MAQSIKSTSKHVLNLLRKSGVEISTDEEERINNFGIIELDGNIFWIANVRSPYSKFGIKINKDWFVEGKRDIFSKPSIRPRDSRGLYDIDYTLIPSSNKLFVLSSIELKNYAWQLENDREIWFKKSTWGIVLFPESNQFSWEGGNPKRFNINIFGQTNDEEIVDLPLNEEEKLGLNDYEGMYPEGNENIKTHVMKERNTTLIKKAKELWSKESNGDIICKVCGFSFRGYYGEIGDGFIEAHHIIPLSKLSGLNTTKISDLIPVCSNCHRMLHRNSDIAPEELKEIIANKRIQADAGCRPRG